MPKKTKNKIFSISDLYEFCVKNNFEHFCTEENEIEICVTMPAKFEMEDIDKDKEGLRPFTAKAYHDHINLNKSEIHEETLINTLPSATIRPILANIVKNEDTNELDFGSHDFVTEEDEDGNQKIIYKEKPVGVIFGENTIEYDEKAKVNRAILHGFLYEGYCQDAIDILERRGGTDCSVELNIRQMSYSAKNKTLVLEDFYIGGLTLLGANHSPGMAGSNLSLDSFSKNDKNNVFSLKEDLMNNNTYDIIQEFKQILDNYTKSMKGGRTVIIDELLEKYSIKNKENLPFETDGLSDEELEQKFLEAYGKDDNAELDKDDKEDKGQENFNNENNIDKPEFTTIIKDFQVSLSQKCNGLWDLVNEIYSETDNTYYGVECYDTYVIMKDWNSNKFYKQMYTDVEDVYTLVGDRVEVFVEYLTLEELDTIKETKVNYENLQKYKTDSENLKKKNLLSEKCYSKILETEEFKTLISKKDEFALEELEEKANAILGKFSKKVFDNEALEKDNKSIGKQMFNAEKENKKLPYGGLFTE